MTDNRFPSPGVDARFPSPGVDADYVTPGVDEQFPAPGQDGRFQVLSPITATLAPATSSLTVGQSLDDTTNWATFLNTANYASSAGTIVSAVPDFTGASVPDATTAFADLDTNRFAIVVTDSEGNVRTFNAGSRAVRQASIAFSEQPSIGGTPTVGQTLTFSEGVAGPAATLEIVTLTLGGVDKTSELVGLEWDTTGETPGEIQYRVRATNSFGTILSDLITVNLAAALDFTAARVGPDLILTGVPEISPQTFTAARVGADLLITFTGEIFMPAPTHIAVFDPADITAGVPNSGAIPKTVLPLGTAIEGVYTIEGVTLVAADVAFLLGTSATITSALDVPVAVGTLDPITFYSGLGLEIYEGGQGAFTGTDIFEYRILEGIAGVSAAANGNIEIETNITAAQTDTAISLVAVNPKGQSTALTTTLTIIQTEIVWSGLTGGVADVENFASIGVQLSNSAAISEIYWGTSPGARDLGQDVNPSTFPEGRLYVEVVASGISYSDDVLAGEILKFETNGGFDAAGYTVGDEINFVVPTTNIPSTITFFTLDLGATDKLGEIVAGAWDTTGESAGTVTLVFAASAAGQTTIYTPPVSVPLNAVSAIVAPAINSMIVGAQDGENLQISFDFTETEPLPYTVYIVIDDQTAAASTAPNVVAGTDGDDILSVSSSQYQMTGPGIVNVNAGVIPAGTTYRVTATVADADGHLWSSVISQQDIEIAANAPKVAFVLAGQSNMASTVTNFDSAAEYTLGTLQVARTGSISGGTDGQLVQASEPLDHVNAVAGKMGVGLQAILDYEAANPTHDVVVIPVAQGLTSFQGGNWNKGDALYEDAVSRTNAFFTANPGYSLGGIFWHQGESDANTAPDRAAYGPALLAMIADMRADITVADATTPFVMGGLADGNSNYVLQNETLASIPDNIPYAAFAASTGLATGDGVHFTAASLRTLGSAMHTQLATAIGNAPTVPGTVGGLTATPASTTVSLSWNTSATSGNQPATGYEVFRSVDSGATYTSIATVSGTTTSYLATGLTNGTEYYFQVVQSNASGAGAAATVISTPVVVAGPGTVQSSTTGQSNATSASYTFPMTTAAGQGILFVSTYAPSGTTRRVGSITIGGVAVADVGAARIADQLGTNDRMRAEAFVIPTELLAGSNDVVVGTVDAVALTTASTTACSAHLASCTDINPAQLQVVGVADDSQLVSTTLNTETDGLVFGYCFAAVAGTGAGWTGYDTQVVWTNNGSGRGHTYAYGQTDADNATYPVSLDQNGIQKAHIFASFGPAA